MMIILGEVCLTIPWHTGCHVSSRNYWQMIGTVHRYAGISVLMLPNILNDKKRMKNIAVRWTLNSLPHIWMRGCLETVSADSEKFIIDGDVILHGIQWSEENSMLVQSGPLIFLMFQEVLTGTGIIQQQC
jgi:hypothetical protein